MKNPAPWLLSFALPAALLYAWVRASQPDGLQHAAAGMERRIKAAKPKVIVLGSSVAFRDVDREVLAASLGLPTDDVLMATIPASTAAHWYAVLKWRVFDQPSPPKVVLIVDALASMLTPLVDGHEERLRLADHVTTPDPSLGLKAFGDPNGVAVEQRRLAWRELRRAWVGSVPDAMIGLLWGAEKDPLGSGRQLVLEATDRTFAPDQRDLTRHGGIPEMFRPPEPQRTWHIPEHPDQSFLPELLELCAAHGATPVFIRAPFPPSFPEVDRLPPAVEHDAAAFIHAHGGLYLDLRSLGLDDARFSDRDHANPDGARQITEAAAALITAHVAAARPWRGEAPSLTVGFNPSLPPWTPPLAQALDGDADLAEGVVASPGATLRWRADAAWPTDAAVRLRASADGHARATLRWSGAAEGEAPLDGTGTLIAASTPGGFSAGPLTVELRVDAASAPVRVDSLSVGAPARMSWWIGDDIDARPGAIRLAGGRISDHQVVPTWASPPPPIPAAPDRPVRAGRAARFDLPRLTALADAPSDPDVLAKMDEGAQAGNDFLADACSPLRVLEDGVALPWQNTFCDHVGRLGHGRACHVGDALLFSASDGTDPLRNGRRYTLALTPDRSCHLKVRRGQAALFDGVWLYPGDTGTFAAPPDRRASLPAGASTLHLRAWPLWTREDSALIVRVGDQAWTVPAADLADDRSVALPLVSPVAADTPVSVENPGAGFWMLTYLAMVEEGSL